MRQAVVLTCLVLIAAGCPVISPSPEGELQDLADPATEAGYALYVPPWYTPEESWPLAITLHGTYGYDGPRRQVREMAYLADRHGFILAAPELDSVQGIMPVYGGLWRRDLERDRKVVLSLIDKLSAEYNIDPEAILLTGFSAGGFVMYDVGLRHPERFQMLIARSSNTSIDLLENIHFTDSARQLPIFLFWGKDDPASKMGWKAFEYLRSRRFFNTRKKEITGGHWRRPGIAMQAWLERWTPYHRDKAQRLGRKTPTQRQ